MDLLPSEPDRLAVKPDSVALIDTSLNCFRAELPAGSRAILFGSQARGDARGDSDLDWLVIERAVPDRAAETVRLSCLLGQQLVPADVVVMSTRLSMPSAWCPIRWLGGRRTKGVSLNSPIDFARALLQQNGLPAPTCAQDLPKLIPYGVAMRYEDALGDVCRHSIGLGRSASPMRPSRGRHGWFPEFASGPIYGWAVTGPESAQNRPPLLPAETT